MREFLKTDDEGTYGKATDGKWYLTPLGLARWMDEEGGLSGLMQRNGEETFIEAGCDASIVRMYIAATDLMKAELERIGAVL